MNTENLITKNFKGQEIIFKEIEGQHMVRIDEVAKFCGWVEKKGDKEYIMYRRVNSFLTTLGFSAQVSKGDFIPEFVMYALIGKANNVAATEFMLWVGQTLTDLRTKGVVILDNAEDETINFERKFGKYRIRKTFTNSQVLRKDWEQLKELSKIENKAKRLTGTERLKLYNITFSAVQDRLNNNITELRGSELLALQELLTDIKAATLELSNRVNGGIKSDLTKKLNTANEQLEEAYEYINYIEPNEDEWKYLNLHGFSINSMYEPYVNRATDEAGERKTRAYRMWAVDFAEEMTKLDLDIDFSNGVDVFLKFDYMPRFDCHNFSKSFIDCFANYYGVNDNNFQLKCCDKNNHVNSYDEGRIWFVVRPRTEE